MKKLSAKGRLGISANPTFYFGTPSMKLIELQKVEIWYAGMYLHRLS